jgi:dihydroorotase
MSNSATYDLILKGGHVIDPANGVDEQRDVAVKDGKIAEVTAGIDKSLATKIVDVAGLHLTPGLIDLHTHHFGKHAHIHPDVYAMPAGVTTVVDAGTSGADSFEEFNDTVIASTTTRVLALINICRSGMINHSEQDVTQLQAGPCAAVMKAYPDQIIGIKAAHFDGPGYSGIEAAVQAGDDTSKPVMIDYHRHPTRNYRGLLERLRPGDTHTHMYGRHTPQMDSESKLYSFIEEARERGIQFDVGHGGFSFWFSTASKLIPQGHIPNTISTDVHTGSYFMLRATMPMVMSKLMNLGISLYDVVKMSTSAPASWMKRPELGNLSIGVDADIAAFEVEHGEFGFVDSGQARMEGNTRLTCHMTVRDGNIVWDLNGLSRPDYKGHGDYISLNRDMSEYADWTGYDNS